MNLLYVFCPLLAQGIEHPFHGLFPKRRSGGVPYRARRFASLRCSRARSFFRSCSNSSVTDLTLLSMPDMPWMYFFAGR